MQTLDVDAGRFAEHWAIVLAAADGTQRYGLTSDRHGVAVPKQCCSIQGGARYSATRWSVPRV